MPRSVLEDRLYRLACQVVPPRKMVRNARPDWLGEASGMGRLELDLYVPHLDIAFEVQGQQHYAFSEFFHGDWDGFRAQLARDEAKAMLCQCKRVELIYVYDDVTLNVAIETLQYREIPDYQIMKWMLGVKLPQSYIVWVWQDRPVTQKRFAQLDKHVMAALDAISAKVPKEQILRRRKYLRAACSKVTGNRQPYNDDWLADYERWISN